jgi:hypothetical protein
MIKAFPSRDVCYRHNAQLAGRAAMGSKPDGPKWGAQTISLVAAKRSAEARLEKDANALCLGLSLASAGDRMTSEFEKAIVAQDLQLLAYLGTHIVVAGVERCEMRLESVTSARSKVLCPIRSKAFITLIKQPRAAPNISNLQAQPARRGGDACKGRGFGNHIGTKLFRAMRGGVRCPRESGASE